MEAEDEGLVRTLYPSLRRFAAVVGPLEVDPDDLVQEALVRALRLRRLADYDDAGAYLRRTIVNLASNERRRLGRRRRALARLTPRRGDTDRALDAYSSDLAELLSLPPDVRAVVYLADVEGYPLAVVAELLGSTDAAVRAAASRARRRLRAVAVENAVEEP